MRHTKKQPDLTCAVVAFVAAGAFVLGVVAWNVAAVVVFGGGDS